jgi:hypothetical protein
MKKLYTLSFIMLAYVGLAQSIPFTGTGELSANGWVVTGTPTAPATDFPGHLQILATPSDSGNSLSFAGLAPSSGNRTTTTHNNTQDCNFAITSNTGTAYYSVLIKVTNTTGMFANTANGEYFMHFAGTAGTGAGTFNGRLYSRQGSTPNTFNLGVWNGSNATGGTGLVTYPTGDLVVGQTYFIVVKYDRTSNEASLFINPTPGSPEPTPNITNSSGTSPAPAQVAAICIRQSGGVTAANSTGNIEIDEIRVSDNWSTVTPGTLATNQNTISGLKVYASNNNLYVTSDNNNIKSVLVYNILGKNVVKTTVTNQAVNVADLSSGIYIVKVTENGKINTVKVVLQ